MELNGWTSPQMLRLYGASTQRPRPPDLRPHHGRHPVTPLRPASTASPAHHHLATRRQTTRPHRQWPALQPLRVQEPAVMPVLTVEREGRERAGTNVL